MSLFFFYHHASDIWELNHKVAFDGPNKLILVNRDVLSLDLKINVYSDWKEWIILRDNMKYLAALRTVGGDPTIESNFLGSTFFLVNGWRLRTWEGDHELIVNGNLFVDGGGATFVPTIDPHNIQITSQRSNLVDLLVVSASGGSTSGSFDSADRVTLQNIETIVANLPDSGSLSTLSADTFDIRTATVMQSGGVVNCTLTEVTTSLTETLETFDGMFIALTSGSTGVTRKIETFLSGGIAVFDVPLPFTFPSGSNATVLPGYNPINGRIG